MSIVYKVQVQGQITNLSENDNIYDRYLIPKIDVTDKNNIHPGNKTKLIMCITLSNMIN